MSTKTLEIENQNELVLEGKIPNLPEVSLFEDNEQLLLGISNARVHAERGEGSPCPTPCHRARHQHVFYSSSANKALCGRVRNTGKETQASWKHTALAPPLATEPDMSTSFFPLLQTP